MAHEECLELSGRWVRTQNSRRILSVVWVGGILGVPMQEIPITRHTEDSRCPIPIQEIAITNDIDD